jgi:methylmalonyl-CoA carboxyltransferase 1.3S subunit
LKLHVVIDGKTYEVEYDTAEETFFSTSSLNRAQSIILPVPGEQNGDSGIDESKVFRNPVAGIVTRIHVEPGQRVEALQVLMVVEAMKMENSLAANGPATVASVKVKAGDTVKVGQIAIEFE